MYLLINNLSYNLSNISTTSHITIPVIFCIVQFNSILRGMCIWAHRNFRLKMSPFFPTYNQYLDNEDRLHPCTRHILLMINATIDF